MPRPLSGYFLGKRPYAPTLALMEELFELRLKDEVADTILLLEHEPVVTFGRGAHAENLLASEQDLLGLGVALQKTGRGGDVTLHAPGQLIAYPIIDLNPDRRDVRKYVGSLTEVMRRLVLPYGIEAGTISKMIGLWTDASSISSWQGEHAAGAPTKLGAIGVRISRWITQHGFALNLSTDLSYFGLIVPCGIGEYPVASVKSLTGITPDLYETARLAMREFDSLLGEGQGKFSDVSREPLDAVVAHARSRRP